jgi:hypothetical protein
MLVVVLHGGRSSIACWLREGLEKRGMARPPGHAPVSIPVGQTSRSPRAASTMPWATVSGSKGHVHQSSGEPARAGPADVRVGRLRRPSHDQSRPAGVG